MSDDHTPVADEEPEDRPDPDLDPASMPPRGDLGPMLDEPPGPINWNLLTADDAEAAWLELNQPVGQLASRHLWPARIGDPSDVAPASGTALGTERVAHALAVRV